MGAKLSFELDAGKILAKLHRGACQTYPKVLFFNSGITNDAEIAPEEVDDAKINFDMDGDEYELGVIIQEEMIVDIELANGVSIFDVAEKLNQYLEKKKKSIDDMDDKEWTTLHGDFCKKAKSDMGIEEFKEEVTEVYNEKYGEEDKKRKEKEEKDADDKEEKGKPSDNKKDEKTEATDDKNTPITQNPSEKQVNEDITTMDPEQNPENFNDMIDAMTTADDQEFTRLEKAAKGDAAEAVRKNHDTVKKFMEKNMEDAATYLQAYMKTFAGEDEAKNITPDKISVTYVPADKANPYKIKKYEKYQIPALTDEQVRQQKIKQMKDHPKATEFSYKNMCFKIAYKLDIGK